MKFDTLHTADNAQRHRFAYVACALQSTSESPLTLITSVGLAGLVLLTLRGMQSLPLLTELLQRSHRIQSVGIAHCHEPLKRKLALKSKQFLAGSIERLVSVRAAAITPALAFGRSGSRDFTGMRTLKRTFRVFMPLVLATTIQGQNDYLVNASCDPTILC